MSQVNVQQVINPLIEKVEQMTQAYRERPKWKTLKEVDEKINAILPEGIGHDFILRAGKKVEHIFYEINNNDNAIII